MGVYLLMLLKTTRSQSRVLAADPQRASLEEWKQSAEESLRGSVALGEKQALLAGLEATLALRNRLPDRPMRIVCFGAESYTTARFVAEFAREEKLAVRITAVEMHSELVDVGRHFCADFEEIIVTHGDPRSLLLASGRGLNTPHQYRAQILPAAGDSSEHVRMATVEPFDWIIVSNLFQFCEDSQVPSWLRMMTECATCGWVVNEPARSMPAMALTAMITWRGGFSSLYRKTARRAVRRAFSFAEWYAMSRRSFVRSARPHKFGWMRILVTRVDKNIVVTGT